MKKQLSPAVAIVLILVVLGIAFGILWMKTEASDEPLLRKPPGGGGGGGAPGGGGGGKNSGGNAAKPADSPAPKNAAGKSSGGK